MPQIFPRRMNTLSRVSIFGAVFIVAALVWLAAMIVRSPYVTEAGVVRTQPVPFSHKHHVADAGIDCRFCHSSVETSSQAGMPATEVCMGCHSQLWRESELLAPVRRSYETGRPIRWTRVHDVPDFAYFNHSIHVSKGIGCVTCHGEVDEMPLMWREETLHMEWCLRCHRHPAQHVRPQEYVYRMDSMEEIAETGEFAAFLERKHPDLDAKAPDVLFQLRSRLAEEYGVRQKTNCSHCHR